MRPHLRRRQGPRVYRGLVERAGEPVAGRPRSPAGEAVAPDAPVAGVLLGTDLRVAADELTVDVQIHAARTLRGDDLVPGVVVVAGGCLDRALGSRVDTEAQLARVGHEDVTVVAGRVAGARGAEADELASTRGVRPEPDLFGVDVRVLHGGVGGHAVVCAVEGDGSVADQADAAGAAQAGAVDVAGRLAVL